MSLSLSLSNKELRFHGGPALKRVKKPKFELQLYHVLQSKYFIYSNIAGSIIFK